MKVTVGDVINNKVNVRKYMAYDEETKRIFVDGNALDVVLIDRSDEWQKLKDENRRYKQALEEIVSFDDFVDSLDYADNILRIAFRALQGDAE